MYQLIVCLFLALTSCSAFTEKEKNIDITKTNKDVNMEKATFGAGCFWCVEAIFTELKGVVSVEPGYAGGAIENPTYKAVCSGTTGHAEVAQITYDPSLITFDKLLSVFWKTHDPTTLNKQGADEGTQYRSVIFFHTEDQKVLAKKYKQELSESGAWANPIVTEISELMKFYIAENYHRDYYANNKDNQYCRYVIQPKVEKFRKVFVEELK